MPVNQFIRLIDEFIFLKEIERKDTVININSTEVVEKVKKAEKRNRFYTWMEKFEENLMRKHVMQREQGHVFDYISRYLFPLSYFTFLLFYFIIYFHI